MSKTPSEKDFFVFTEIARCGQIGYIALKSFFTYHPDTTVHVFGIESDRPDVAEFKNVVFHSLDRPQLELESWGKQGWIERQKMVMRSKKIAKNFDLGHLGTASLWAHIIQTRPEKYIIHFDSDVIFRAEVMSDITKPLSDGYDLVGQVRNYRNSRETDEAKKDHEDVVATCVFGFCKEKINEHSYQELTMMCKGGFNPLGFPVIDFFDPVSFEILHNGGKRAELSADEYGGENNKGSRKNKFAALNAIVDFGSKFCHFSSVGSGMNFYKNAKDIKAVPNPYIEYSLERYAVYVKVFYNQDIGVEFDKKKFEPLFHVDRWY